MNKLFGIIICGILLVFSISALAVEIPDTYSAKQLNNFITVLNSGDSLVWKDYLLTDKKAQDSINVYNRRMEVFVMMWDNHSGFELYKMKSKSEYQANALVKSINEQAMFEWVEISFEFSTVPPHGWAGMSIQPTDNPNIKIPEGKLSNEQMVNLIDDYIDDQVSKDKFSGTVIVAKNGKPFYQRVEGQACKRNNIPNKLDTKFNLGSMNKMFTGVAIAQLVEQGKISFDDYVGKHLPDFSNQEIKEKVTIHHLLTHTSGIGDYWEELFDSKFWEIRTVEQLANLTKDKPLNFDPGTEFRYSNAGPIILGLIIEKISGLTYDEYILKNVTGPAGMINTDCFAVDNPVPNLAIGYTHEDVFGNYTEQWHSNYFMHAAKGGPAGGGYSTVEDLTKFAVALLEGTLISKEMFKEISTGKSDMGPDMKYAYLFGEHFLNGHRSVGHNGGAPGINAGLDIYTESGYSVAVMANIDMAAMPVTDFINKLITQE